MYLYKSFLAGNEKELAKQIQDYLSKLSPYYVPSEPKVLWNGVHYVGFVYAYRTKSFTPSEQQQFDAQNQQS